MQVVWNHLGELSQPLRHVLLLRYMKAPSPEMKVDLEEEAMRTLELSAWDNAWFLKACG